jgi:phosphoserine phosphatase
MKAISGLFIVGFALFLNAVWQTPVVALDTNGDINGAAGHIDPLPSWTAGDHKQRILRFVQDIADKQSKNFVPESERFATFDNDGTILCEKPAFFEVIYARDRAREIQAKHPTWAKDPEVQKFLGASDDDLSGVHTNETIKVMAESSDDMSQAGLREASTKWLNTAVHPRYHVLYKKLHYAPMLELLSYLRANGFKVYLCSGGQTEFMRCYVDEEYGVDASRVLGSNLDFAYANRDGKSEIVAGAHMHVFNVGPAKPVTILEGIGRRPLIACGNSDGDLEMLTYGADRQGPSLSILVHHDDDKREYKYDVGAEKVLPLAASRNWLVVSMKDDFARIFDK